MILTMKEEKQTKLGFKLYGKAFWLLKLVGISLSLHCKQCEATIPIDWAAFKRHQEHCH
jgi:hypothetical protein